MKPSVAKLFLSSLLLLFFNLILTLTSPTYTTMVSAYDDNHHLENPDNRYNKTIYHSIKAGGGGGSSGGGGRGGGGSSSSGGGRGGGGSSSGGRGGISGTGSRGSGGGRAGSGSTGSSGTGTGGVIGGGVIGDSGRGDGGTNNRDGRSVSSAVDNGLPLIVVVTAVTTSLIVSFSSFS